MRPSAPAPAAMPASLIFMLAALFVALAGCSNNLTQTPFTTSSLRSAPDPRPVAPQQATATQPSYQPAPRPQVPSSGAYQWNGNADRVAVGEPAAQPVYAPPAAPALNWMVSPRAPVPAVPTLAPAANGQMIEVQPGDTLYTLSKRHRVSVASLVDANKLSGVAIGAGQKLVLPRGAR